MREIAAWKNLHQKHVTSAANLDFRIFPERSEEKKDIIRG
jgi:hypothetical protein